MNNEQREHEEELWKRAREFDGIPRAESYHELSKIAYDREEYSEALNMCLIAKEIFEKDQANSHNEEILNLYQGIINSYECLEECEKAESVLIEAIEFARITHDDSLASLLRQLGRLYFEHEKYAESIECHTEAMIIPPTQNHYVHEGIDYINIGMCHHRLKDYPEAVRFKKIGLEKFREVEVDSYWLINSYGELAESYIELQMADEVLHYGQKALDWWEIEKNHQKCWTMKLYLAQARRIKGNLDEALDLLMEARELAIDHSNKPQSFLVDVDKEEGEILIMQGKVEAGQELLRRSASVKSVLDEEKRK